MSDFSHGFLLGSIVLTLMLPATTAAMIIHHDRDDEIHRQFAKAFADIHVELNVPGRDGQPGPGGNGLGTLIAPRWILTAAHVAQSFTPGHPANRSRGEHHVTHLGRNYRVARVVLHPDYMKRSSRVSDIALVELEEPIVNPRYVDLYRTQDELGQRMIFIGSGHFGTGLTGPLDGDRILRGATNRVASVDERLLYFIFDPPGSADATELEGINGPGDSGSGALIERGGRLYIAGVSCCQDYDDTEGLYGVTEIYPRVSHYADWIDSVTSKAHPPVMQSMTTDPAQASIRVDDIRRLSELLRSARAVDAHELTEAIQRDYLGNSTPGLLAYADNFNVTGASLAAAISANPAWYADLDGLADAMLGHSAELEAGFRALKELFPAAVFPPTWFVAGGHGPRGQAAPQGALIGAEGLVDRPAEVAPLVVHEMVHFQSAMVQGVSNYRRIYSGPERTLLALALREGSAELIAQLATGSHTNPQAEAYGLENEARLWGEFREVMHGTDIGDWMWTRPNDPGRPANLGYWIGYRICQAYYEQAEDKQQAIADIIGLIDFDAFLQASGYPSGAH